MRYLVPLLLAVGCAHATSGLPTSREFSETLQIGDTRRLLSAAIAAASDEHYCVVAVNRRRSNFVTAPISIGTGADRAEVSFVVWLTDLLGAYSFYPWVTVVVTPVAFRDGRELSREELPREATDAARRLVADIHVHAEYRGM
jgi:hypothetical protein